MPIPRLSYTAKLKADGMARAGKKLGEEAVEAVIAAISGDKDRADQGKRRYSLSSVGRASHRRGERAGCAQDELERRTAQSGLEEKAGSGQLRRADGAS